MGDYLLSFSYKVSSGSRGKLQIYRIADAVTAFDTGWLDSTSWQGYDVCFCTSEAFGAKVVVENTDDEFTIDNLVIMDQMVANCGFESTNDWYVSNASLAVDDANERSGTYAAKITASADAGYIYQDVTVVDGEWYTIEFHGKGSSAGHRFKFKATGATTSTDYYDSGYIDSTSYKKRGCTFKVDGDTSIRVKGVVETSGEICYFDDWSMVPLIAIAPSTETPSVEDDHWGDPRW